MRENTEVTVQEIEETVAFEDCMHTGGVCDCENLALCRRIKRNCKNQLAGATSAVA